MPFQIDLFDLYEGYVEANAINPLDRKVIQTDSTWTYFVINHFAQLGRLLGFEIELEKEYSHGSFIRFSINQVIRFSFFST